MDKRTFSIEHDIKNLRLFPTVLDWIIEFVPETDLYVDCNKCQKFIAIGKESSLDNKIYCWKCALDRLFKIQFDDEEI